MIDKDMAVEAAEPVEQTSDVGDLWDTVDEAADQRLDEPAMETEQTSEDRAEVAESSAETASAGSETGDSQSGQGEPAAKEQPVETFVLRHLDDPPRNVGREEVIRLAQQGLDYERVRQERDSLRASRQEDQQVVELVKGFAARSGMSVAEYVDYCRTQDLMAQGVNEATAKAQVEIEKQRLQMDKQAQEAQDAAAEANAEQQKAQERSQAQRKDMEAFLTAYPNVKATEIPKEVWQRVAAGGSLVTEYTRWENTQLRAKLAAQESRQNAAEKAPGSMTSRGQQGRKTIDDYWDDAGD